MNTTKKKKTEKQRSYNISVVGFSGPVDGVDIIDGIGKSSFCARFTQPHQDEYKRVDKRSIISPVDFGSKLINNRNTLWWGNTHSSGQAFSLLEHTVFLDDSRLEPFESRNSKTDKYESRCGETTFKNWMQKQFFGFSNQQDNDSTEMIPERFKIDAFLILIDVSKERLEKQELQRQLDFVARIIKNIKTKSYPVVLGLTKFDLLKPSNNDQSTDHDQSTEASSEQQEHQIIRKIRDYFRQHEFAKKLTKRELHIVETSAERNINIKETFKLLAHLIDKTKGKTTKTVEVKSYREQSKESDKAESEVYAGLSSLLKDELIRYEVTWEVERARLAAFGQFEQFKAIFGTDLAKKAFKERLKNLKNLYKGTIVRGYRIYIEMALNALIVSNEQLRNSWDELMEQVEDADNFSDWFIKLEGYDQQGYNYEKRQFWIEDEHVSSLTDKRIPFHLLRMKLPDGDAAGHKFRSDLLQRLHIRFAERSDQNHDDSLDTSLNDSIDFLLDSESGSPAMLHRASSARVIDRATPETKCKLRSDRVDGRWSWSGGENLKIILLGANGLTKELAAEITHSPDSGEETSSSSLEVIKVEEAYERVKVELLTRRPHGCIAVYSDRTTFDYCHEWLTASLVDFKGLPVSILMASDRDLADADRDELINKGKQLVDQLSPTSTGRFIAPLGGSYLDMRRIHQSQIKQGLQMILDDLKKVAGFQKPITIGCGSSRLDRQPIDRLQSYLIHAGCVLEGDKLVFKSKYQFSFFDVNDASPDYDAMIIAFSQPNGQNECSTFVASRNERKIQFLIGHSDRAELMRRTLEERFKDIVETHPVLMGPLVHQASLAQLERIIISAQAQRDTRSLDESLFDLNSNIESSLGDDDSVDSQLSRSVKYVRDKFEEANFVPPKKVPLGSSITRLDGIKRKSLPSVTMEEELVQQQQHKPSSLLSQLMQKGTSSKHSTGSSDSEKPRKTPKPTKRNSFRGKLRRENEKTTEDDGSNESLDQLGLSVDRAVDLNNTLNSTIDTTISTNQQQAPLMTPRQTPSSAHHHHHHDTSHQPKEKTRRARPWTRKRTEKHATGSQPGMDLSLMSQNGDEWLETSRFFKKPLQRDDYASALFTDVDRTSLLYPGLVPAFVREIVARLEDDGGLDTEGLYRVPADRKKRQELLKCFDANYRRDGVPVNYEHLHPAPNTLAGCIQWYISPKNLPEPIIPKKFLSRLHEAMKPDHDETEKIERLRAAFTELGAEKEAHWQTIKYLCHHFNRVSELSQTNQMHAKNIATCLFPTFFSDIFAGQFTAESFTMDSGIYIDILVVLIEKHDLIFVDDHEVVKSATLRNARQDE